MQVPKRKPSKASQIPWDPYVTQKKYEAMEAELVQLKKKQPHAAKEVARLAELGDFSENVEYQLAKRRLRGINNAILRMEQQLLAAEIIDTSEQGDRVVLGSTVDFLLDGNAKQYRILGASETDPGQGVISHQSPLGKALLGKKKGERYSILLGGKEKTIDIVEVSG